MIRFALPLFLAVLALALATARPAAAIDHCANANTTVELSECAVANYKDADRALNQAYAAFKKTLDAQGAKLLLEAQRAWIKFRDTNCEVVADSGRGGTLVAMLTTNGLADMTTARAKELTEQAKGLGN